MTLRFPDWFFFGTSTSAYQIETAFEHDWEGIAARDGNKFLRTTDHESHLEEDVSIIASLAPHYRMSLMWSKLQREAYADFNPDAVTEYTKLLAHLFQKDVKIMMVLHHWCNPRWFEKMGGWENPASPNIFFDFAKRVVDTFGKSVTLWNTFNEPNLYTTFAFLLGEFPPYKRDLFKALKVVENMGKAHELLYTYIKSRSADSIVGISHNCVSFAADNWQGYLPQKLADYWYMDKLIEYFQSSDFIGISYYARMAFDPYPVTYLEYPEKFSKVREHDDIWEYYPQGMEESILKYWDRFKKPIIITENGFCTNDDSLRIKSIKDYMTILHKLLHAGVDIRGYYHWSTWDNFEWSLGPSYRFGLYHCDIDTKARTKKPSADFYSSIAYTNSVTI
jgi:beta-glucosidase